MRRSRFFAAIWLSVLVLLCQAVLAQSGRTEAAVQPRQEHAIRDLVISGK